MGAHLNIIFINSAIGIHFQTRLLAFIFKLSDMKRYVKFLQKVTHCGDFHYHLLLFWNIIIILLMWYTWSAKISQRARVPFPQINIFLTLQIIYAYSCRIYPKRATAQQHLAWPAIQLLSVHPKPSPHCASASGHLLSDWQELGFEQQHNQHNRYGLMH